MEKKITLAVHFIFHFSSLATLRSRQSRGGKGQVEASGSRLEWPVSTCRSKRLLYSLRVMEHFGGSGPVVDTGKIDTKVQTLFPLCKKLELLGRTDSGQSLLMLLRPEHQETGGLGFLAYTYTTGVPSRQRECLCLHCLALNTQIPPLELSEENS